MSTATRPPHSKGPLTGAEPVRQHVRALMAAGVSIQRLAAHTGVAHSVLSTLLYPAGNRRQSARIRTANARPLLAVRPEDVAPRYVDATGTVRRIQALVAAGWPQLHIGPRIGRHPVYVNALLKQTRVFAVTAHRVATAYEALWDANPQHHGVPLDRSKAARTFAKRNGWVPPAAWDDDAIDDPDGRPDTGEGAEMNRDELAAYRRQEIAFLASYSIPEQEIAARLGMAPAYVHDLIRDMKAAA
ncbi:hypothetical protein ACH4FX_38880 [Streptomyces sp. NPDC018019]|uniref:hypothetical protein n=1 Tax=Streptomyces sp. NPDC018019 TaxID=3365030 RepID=UPI0037B40A01